jgi:hypothetical protein
MTARITHEAKEITHSFGHAMSKTSDRKVAGSNLCDRITGHPQSTMNGRRKNPVPTQTINQTNPAAMENMVSLFVNFTVI